MGCVPFPPASGILSFYALVALELLFLLGNELLEDIEFMAL